MVRAEIKILNGGPTLFVDGRPVFPLFHWVPTPPEEGYWVGEGPLKDFSEVGVHLHTFAIDIGEYVKVWEGEGAVTEVRDRKKVGGASFLNQREEYAYNFSKLDKQLERILNVNPDAYILLRVGLEMGSPLSVSSTHNWWWRQRNPRELELYSDGRAETQSYASEKWLRDCSDFLASLIDHLRSNSAGFRVIGIQPGAGHTTEWCKESAMEGYASDYSEVMRDAFRLWLVKKYGSLEALREAWQDPYVHFNKVEIPSPKEQAEADIYHFRDPSRSRKVMDYFEFFSDLTADDIIHFCKVVKETSRWEMLAGVFYGYLLGLAWCNWFFDQGKNRSTSAYQRSGHLALSKVLASPYVDFIASPYSYGFRGIGGDSAPMSIVESIRLHGKLYFIEDDTRTHLFPPDAKYGRARDQKETLSILTRTFGRVLTSSGGLWYADWCSPNRPGPYQDREIMERISRFLRMGERSLKLDRSIAGEIAVIVDEKSFLYERMVKNLDYPLVFLQKLWGLSRIGAPYDVYLLSDIDKVPDHYKCYLFLNTFYLDDNQRTLVKRAVRRDGKVSVWLYASGMINRDISAENMKDIIGIDFFIDWTEWGLRMLISNFDHPITRDLPPNTSFGTDLDLGPVPYVDDINSMILGTLVYSRGMCVPGMAIKEFSNWKSIYIGAPNVPSNLLRSIAKYAGVHIFNYSDEVLYADKNFIALHAIKNGEKRIFLPREADVYDAIENRLLAKGKNEFVDTAKSGETKLYYYGEAPW